MGDGEGATGTADDDGNGGGAEIGEVWLPTTTLTARDALVDSCRGGTAAQRSRACIPRRPINQWTARIAALGTGI